jgi:RNA polymerase sigma factor (sigma-70 family)
MPSKMLDQDIIALIRTNKSDKALVFLYKHFAMMQKIIRHNGGNTQDAEDVFQEALIILVRNVKVNDFTLTAKLSTYLFSICRFLWKEELRKRKHHISYDFESGLTPLEERELEVVVERENKAKLAEKVLDGLQERCRELLLLFYEGQLKLKDIAVKMGYSSANTAKNQKYKCLESAKNRLKELKLTSPTF